MGKSSINFDAVLRRVGEFGKAQLLLYCLVGLCGIPTGEQHLSSVFTTASQRHWCLVPQLQGMPLEERLEAAIPKKANGSYSSCRRYDLNYSQVFSEFATNGNVSSSSVASLLSANTSTVECQEWEFDTGDIYSTVGSQFELVCSRSFLLKMVTSFYMAGCFFGATISGVVSDKIGRVKCLVGTAVLHSIFAVAAALVPWLWLYIICRFVVAAAVTGTFTISFVIAMEIIGPKWRMQPGIFVQGWFAIGFLLLALLAFFIRNHVTLQLVLALQPLVFVPYYWLYPESPRWLAAQGRFSESTAICRRIARLNGRQLPADFSVRDEASDEMLDGNSKEAQQQQQQEQQQEQQQHRDPHSGSIMDLVRTPNMRKRSLNVFYNWFTNSIVYYGLSLNIENLGGSIYVNTAISGLVEFPAFVMCCVTVNRFGRVKMLVFTLLLGGLGCITSAFASITWLRISLAMVGKFAISASFAIIYVYSAEVFPTVVRNVGVGVSSASARVGGLLAPQIVLLSKLWQPLPFVLIGSISVAAGLLSLLLPETLNQPLPDTVEEGEAFGRTSNRRAQDLLDETLQSTTTATAAG